MYRYVRKCMHAIIAVLFAGAALYVPAHTLTVAAAVMLGVFVGARYVAAFDPIRRSEVRSHGEFFFAVGVFIATLVFLPTYQTAFLAGMLVLGLADALAAVVGIRWGTHAYTIFGERRTYEGSVTVLAVSGTILYLCGAHPLWAVAGGWVLAAAEALAPRGSDNIVLPLLAGGIILLLT